MNRVHSAEGNTIIHIQLYYLTTCLQHSDLMVSEELA